MEVRLPAWLFVLAVLLMLPACGSGTPSASPSTPTSPKTTRTQSDTAAAKLERAAERAIRENFRLSVYVLWHNHVPSWASRSTRGPALAALRSAAAARRKQGVRIRSLGGQYRVLRLTLDLSYARATATVRDRRSVVPYRAGRRLGRIIRGDERARIDLHRLGRTTQFIVWRVSPLR